MITSAQQALLYPHHPGNVHLGPEPRKGESRDPGPGAHGAFIKTVCCQTSCVTDGDRKQLAFVHTFWGGSDVWTSRVWRSSLVRKWSIKAFQGGFDAHRPKKNTCVKIRSQVHVDFFLLLWHQLPRSCKINLTGSSDHMCLEIKTRAILSESFNETELCGFFFFLFHHTRSTDLSNNSPFLRICE